MPDTTRAAIAVSGLATILTFLAVVIGCRAHTPPGVPHGPPLVGSTVDQIMQQQEDNAEAAKFVIYMHEFELNKPEWEFRLAVPRRNITPRGYRLTPDGQDHVRQIAAQIRRGTTLPVIVERSRTSVDPNTEYKYAVHYNDTLDRQRRAVVVQALTMLGVADANERVVVAPAFSEGYDAEEAAQAYEANFGARSAGRQGFAGAFGRGFN